MTTTDIRSLFHDFFVDRLEYAEADLLPDAMLRADLGMTSLDALETALFIRRTFGFQPERGAIKGLVTLDDLYHYVEQHIIPENP